MSMLGSGVELWAHALLVKGGTFLRRISDIFGDHISVKDFGAGRGGDDTAAFVAAAAAKKRIYVPEGSYTISTAAGEIALPTSARWFGAGRGATFITCVGGGGFYSASDNQRCSLADMTIVGDGTAGKWGIRAVDNPRGFALDRVAVTGFSGVAGSDPANDGGGILLDGRASSGMWGAQLSSVLTEACARGIVCLNDAATTFTGAISRLNRGDPLYCEGSRRTGWLGGTLENSFETQGATSSVGLFLKNCEAFHALGLYFENTINALIRLDGSKHCEIHAAGGYVTSASGILVDLKAGSSHNKVTGMLSGVTTGKTGVSLDVTSNDNDIDVTLNGDGVAISGTALRDLGARNSVRWINGNTGAVTRYQSLTTFPGGIQLGSGSDVLDTFKKSGAFTPSVAFATPGDSVLTPSIAIGQYEQIGKTISFRLSIVFNANAYTTASGILKISGLPGISKTDATLFYYPCGELIAVNMTYTAAAQSPRAAVISNTDTVQIFIQASNSGLSNSSPSNWPAGTTGMKLIVSGTYEAA